MKRVVTFLMAFTATIVWYAQAAPFAAAQPAAGGAASGAATSGGAAGARSGRGTVDPYTGGPASANEARGAQLREDPASGAPIDTGALRPPGNPAESAATAPDAAAPAVEPVQGRATVDSETSARRAAEYDKAPLLPQVFIHQWRITEVPLESFSTRTEEHEVARLTLAEAVQQALANNPGVASQRLTPLRQIEDIRNAESIFDPLLNFEVNRDRREAPNSSALSHVQVSKSADFNANAHLTKTLRSGGQFGIDFTNNRFVSNATFQGLVPQYRPELVFSLNQPLLRNFGLNFAYLLIDVSTITSEAGKYTYRAQLADFVKSVVDAYWAVVFARENVKVQQEALGLARRTVHENEERVRVGLLAPVSVKEAESQAAAIEEQVIVAQNNLDNTRRTLRHLVYLHTGESIVPRQVEPIEEPRTAPVRVDGDAVLAAALEQRPEIIAANLDLRGRNLTERIRENQLLPKLDVVGNIGVNGLSGNPVPVTDINGNVVESRFGGSYGKALDRLTTREFYSYSGGVEIEIPIGNAAAKAAYAQARIDVAQGALNRRQLLSNVTLEVGNAVNNVTANMQRIRATRVARELAEENLRNQQKRLEVGLTTTKDVLDFQNDLTQARATEVQAATDYNISLDELARAEGTILDKYSVVVEVPGERFVPWWARF